MKVHILYHPSSEHSRIVEEYAHDFARIKGKKVDLISLETREGAAMATLYDITRYPAILVTRDDNELLKYWDGVPFPLMDEVIAYQQ